MMVKNLEGKKCPKFSAEATSEQVISNQTYQDKNVVIYFYPKDSTPGCTTEVKNSETIIKSLKNISTLLGLLSIFIFCQMS